MPVQVACPNCKASFSVPIHPYGTRVRCTQCNRAFVATGLESEEKQKPSAEAPWVEAADPEPPKPDRSVRPAPQSPTPGRGRPVPEPRSNQRPPIPVRTESRPTIVLWITGALMLGVGALMAVGIVVWLVVYFGPTAAGPLTGAGRSADPKLTGRWERVYVTDLEEFGVKMGPWPFGKHGRSGDSNPRNADIVVNGIRSPNGLGMHPPNNGFSTVSYALGKQARIFRAEVGLNDATDLIGPTFPVTFALLGDGKLLWRSRAIQSRSITEDVRVDVSGVEVLELRVEAPGSSHNAHAVWLEPELLRN